MYYLEFYDTCYREYTSKNKKLSTVNKNQGINILYFSHILIA